MRRVLHVLGAVLLAVVLPVALLSLLVGSLGVSAMFAGVLLGIVGSKVGGTRRMMYVAPVIGVAAGMGSFTAYGWWWVALLAITGVIAGAGIRFGWLPALLMIPFAATFVTPTSTALHALTYGAIVAIATVYGIVIARRFGAATVVNGDQQSVAGTVAVAAVFGIALGASAAVGVALSWTQPYWVPEPVLILTLYILMGKRERIWEKALGTALGVVAAVPVAIISPPAPVLTAIGIVALALAITQYKRYWLYYGLWTFAIVILLASPGQVGGEAEQRGFQILVGIGLLAVGLVVLDAIAKRLTKSGPQPELAPAD